MDALRRNQYLQAVGVDVWVSRRPAVPVDPAGTAAAVEAVEAATSAAARATDSVGIAHVPAGSPAAAAAASVAAAPASAVAMPGGRLAAAHTPAAGAAGAPTLSPAPVATAASAVTPSTVARGAADVPQVTTWESLRSEVLACTKCPLHTSRTQGVFGVGNREAQWLVVGEAPGAEEDRRGEPFVGRAGHLLDAMLKAIGLSRGRNVYIANVLKSRPPGNRDPKPEEVAACLPYLMRQIELLRPRVMLAVGRIAAQNLLATDAPLGRLRGKVHHFGEFNTPLIVTYHPAYLLRTPSDKRKAWEDLKFARSVFQGLNATL
jgi:uracil-DNA glycosylase family 4